MPAYSLYILIYFAGLTSLLWKLQHQWFLNSPRFYDHSYPLLVYHCWCTTAVYHCWGVTVGVSLLVCVSLLWYAHIHTFHTHTHSTISYTYELTWTWLRRGNLRWWRWLHCWLKLVAGVWALRGSSGKGLRARQACLRLHWSLGVPRKCTSVRLCWRMTTRVKDHILSQNQSIISIRQGV